MPYKFIIPFVLVLVFGYSRMSIAQIAFDYSFDDCTTIDSEGNFQDLQPSSNLVCEQCGVNENSVAFSQSNGYLSFPSSLKEALEANEYTLQFSFLPNQVGVVETLFAVTNGCSRDSSFNIKYIRVDNQVEFTMSVNAGDRWSSRGDINSDYCWHNVAITKKGTQYAFYLDNQFVASVDNDRLFPIHPDAIGYVGYSPCIVDGVEQQYEGYIDELKLQSTALNLTEIINTTTPVDQILSRDTTLILGESLDIISGPSCTSQAQWTSSQDLDDPSSLTPTITPTEVTTYTRTLTYNGCTSRDSITINVIDEDQLDCANLIMPNVFTPNGDGINDKFMIANGFIVEELKSFDIYDRWGALLYSTTYKDAGWDGNINGKPAMKGMYVYRVNYVCQANEHEKHGSFSLFR